MTFRTYHTNKSEKLIHDIMEAESLEVKVKKFTDALGDSIIEVKGETEDITTLKQIYNMVK